MEDETPTEYLSHKERYEVAVRKATHLLGKIRELNRADPPTDFRKDYL